MSYETLRVSGAGGIIVAATHKDDELDICLEWCREAGLKKVTIKTRNWCDPHVLEIDTTTGTVTKRHIITKTVEEVEKQVVCKLQ